MSESAPVRGKPPSLRPAEEADLPSIQAIYAHHVLHGLASFEETPPDLSEITRRFRALRAGGFPYLAAALEGQVVGYAYAGPYRPRPAYRYTVEGSVYVGPGWERRGIGRALLAALIERCGERGYRRMVAVIGDSGHRASIRLHESLGFTRAGLLHAVGFKFGRWVDSVIMERPLGEGDRTLPAEPPP
ncbi:MAG: N-acetyltransferase family protein [Kiloniellales bacterium]|nr:N-acetyltransferase family protein [Kiloniellales bacterium]